jgi:Tfp pilus assembly protein PilN
LRDKLISTFFTSDITVLVLSNKVVVRKGRSGIAARFSRDVVLEYAFSSPEEMQGILDQACKTLNSQPSDRWFLGLPLKYFTLVNFSLPGAALENLDQAVRYSLMRHVPYDLEQAQVNYQVKETGGNLDVSAAIIPSQSLKPFLKPAGSGNITFYSVFPSIVYWARIMGDGVYVSFNQGYGEALVYQNNKISLNTWTESRENDTYFLEESSRLLANIPDLPSTLYLWESIGQTERIAEKLQIKPGEIKTIGSDFKAVRAQSPESSPAYEINLLSPAALRQKKLAAYMIYGGILFFILSLFVFPVSKLAGQKRHLTRIENRLQEISAAADDLNRVREESRLILDRAETMAEMKKNYPSTIIILRELTQVIPETAWVVSLNYANKKITIQGEAESATSVIEAIENSPMFREVRFSSPVTRSGPVDRFTLEAEVVS